MGADSFVADGQISAKEAKTLFITAHDGKGITGTERTTLEYISRNRKLTDKAREYFDAAIKLPDPTSYYRIVDGNKYDAGLCLEIEEYAKDGTVSEAEAQRIWKSAEDGPGVTEIEKATMKYFLSDKEIFFTEPAWKFL